MHKLRKLLLTGVAATAIGAGVFALPPTRAVKPAARRTGVAAAGSSASLSKQTPPLRTPTKIKAPSSGFTAAAARRVEVVGEASPGVVVIPRDWKAQYPFSSRFTAAYGKGTVQAFATASHVIDLAATRFTTDSLVTRDASGARTFADPDLRSFNPQLVRSAFELSDPDFFIVQANDPAAQSSLRAWLESQGMSIIDFLPETAYLVRLSRGELARVQARSEVFWVGLYQPAYRIDPKLDFVIEADPAHELKMQALFDATINPDLNTLHGKVAARGVAVSASARRQRDQKVRVSGQAIKARDLALIPGALWVERFVDPELHNDVARTSSNVATGRGAQSGPVMDVEDVWARGIRGEGQIASAADTGLSTGTFTTLHSDFGQQGSGTNPMRVIKGYALGRTTWSDPESGGGGHGTHTSGSIVGNGFNSGASPGSNSFTTGHAGIAPKAQFVFQSVMDSNGGLGGLPTNLNDLFINPYNDGARVHSNSWGSDANGQYTADSQEVDQFIQSHPDMVITFSAGNSGQDGKQVNFIGQCGTAGFPIDGIVDQDSMGAPATAKNCITVGATENYRPTYAYEYPVNTCTATNNTWGWFNSCQYSVNPIYSDKLADHADGLAAFSSRGPTDDGRIKPDVVAPGTGIVSTRTNQSQSTTATAGWGTCGLSAAEKTAYNSEGGTSMANPLTAGAAVLVRQYYVDGWHANHTAVTNAGPSAGGFAPSAALVKATLINGAWDLSPGQYGTGTTKESAPSWDSGKTLPNNAAGFGRVDLEHSLFPGAGWGDDAGRVIEVHDVTAGMTTGASAPYTFNVTGSANPLIITLAWSDPYAASGAGTKLVNNLDLIVTSPTGVRYYSNGLDKTAGADDTVNNVEQVKVTSPATGAWTVQVRGTNVPGNAVAGSNSQTYALVMSGIAGATIPDTSAPVTSITSPIPGAVITGTTNVTATATDDRGVTRVEFYLDGALQSTDSSAPYAWSWNSATSANGAHTLQSKAFDAAGNSGSSTVVDVTTSNDTVAPTTSITSPASGSTVSGVVAVNADASDDVGVARIEIYLDGAIKQTCAASTCSWSWNTAASSNGAHTLQSKAFDAANNVGNSATVSVTVSNVDSQAPTAPGSLVASGGKKRVDLTWNASADNVGVSSYRVYRADAAAGPFTQVGTTTSTSFGEGGLAMRVMYYYYVVAVDAAGNVSAASNTASATTR
jgi:hypothetical protein